MNTILVIAKRELKRFRSRFSGSSRLVLALVLIAAMVLTYFVSQQGFVLSKDIYTIGSSPGSVNIKDDRFNVLILSQQDGYALLYDERIDLYIDNSRVITRNDERSQYAAGALKQYLEKAELNELIGSSDIDRAFPLRIEVNYLNYTENSGPIIGGSGLEGNIPGPTSSIPSATKPPAVTSTPGGYTPTMAPTKLPVVPGESDSALRDQIKEIENITGGSMFKAEFVSDKEIIIPSLMNPPIPLVQVIIAFVYIVPIFFISIFFTSSFMDEKTNRKLNILMSTPAKPLDIIIGKLLPYFIFSLALVVGMTLFLGGDLFLALAIFLPVILFIFSIYLMVALFYRTFKDQTFFSMTAITFVTGYLVFPALFAGINDLSYISPLTLVVQMYKGETFGLREYIFSTGPMYMIFLLTMFLAVRIFNEEYIMSYGPLYRKVADAIYYGIDRKHLYISIALLSAFLIPVVFMVQLIFIALSVNLPLSLTFGVLLIFCVLAEEIAKSAGIAVLIENKAIGSLKDIAILSFLSALGFLIGEKLLLFLSLSVISDTLLMQAISSANLLVIPLLAHTVFTSIVCLSTGKLGMKFYPFAVIIGSFIHYVYNLYVMGWI